MANSLSVPAFGFSTSMARPVNKSPLDTNRLHSGLDFEGDDARDRTQRLTDFGGYMGAHPGAAPGGTGDTGLNASDAGGWSNLMERQQQFLKDMAVQDGKAAPTVRIGPDDGSNLSTEGGGAAPAPKGRVMASSAAPAMKGLTDILSGGGGGRLPQTITDDPDMYKAYQNMLLDQMQSAGSQARSAGASPAESMMASHDSRIDDMMAGDRQTNRDESDRDVMQGAASKFHAWDSYGRPQAEDVNRMAGDLADVKGKAATYDDLIRGATSRDVAGINAGVQDRRTQSTAAMAGLSAAQRDLASQRTAGGPVNPQDFNARMQATPSGAPGGGGGVQGRPGGKSISRAQVQQKQQENGWSDEQTQQMLQQYGYTVVN